MLVREKERKRGDTMGMESMVMDKELAEEDLKSNHSKVPLCNNEKRRNPIKQHQGHELLSWNCDK